MKTIIVNTEGPRGPQGEKGDKGTGADGGFTGSFSGSFLGNGSELNNIPASAIVGLQLDQIASGTATASISATSGFQINTNTIITGSLTVSGSIIPGASGAFDLGSSTNPWREVYVASSSLNFVDTSTGTSETFTKDDVGNLRTGRPIKAVSQDIEATGSAPSATGLRNYIRPDAILHPTNNKQAILNNIAGRISLRTPRGDAFEINQIETNDFIQIGSTPPPRAGLIGRTAVRVPGTLIVTGSTTINNNLTVLGTGSFTHFITTYESSSIIYASGSTKFGDTLDDTHQRTGSMFITGSLVVTGGTLTGDGSGLTNVFEGTAASQSISTRITNLKTDSGSFSTRITTQETKTSFSGSFSGSFQGDGAGLTNVPASGVVGLNLSQIASGTATASIDATNGFQVNTDTRITGSTNLSGSLKIRGGSALTGANIFEIKNTSADAYDDLFAFDDNGKITHEVDGAGDKHVIQTTSGATMFKFGVSAGSQGYLQIQNNGFTGAYLNNYGGAFGYGATVPTDGKSLYVKGDAQITGSLNINGHTSVTAVTSSNGGRFESAGSAGEFIIKNAGNDADAFTVYMTDGTGTANIGAYGGINFISRYGSIGTVASYNNVGTWGFNYDVNIAPGKHLSGSATSTASFGTYLGDGNNITNISPSNITYGNNIAIGGTVTDTYGNAIGKSATSAGQAVVVGAFSAAAYGGISLGHSTTGGQYTIAIGRDVGHASGQYNVLLGDRAGNNSSGDHNIAIGQLAGFDQTSGTGNITIGSGSRGVAGESNQLRIGHGSHGALISGSLSDGGVMIQGQVSASSYIGDGSGLTGLGGAYGISNSNGVYTYYGTLSASIAAASAGDVVEVFADVTETNPVTILFKNGVNIQGNGHKYTLDHSSSIASFADYLSTETSGTSISSSIHNLRIDRINGDASTANYAATIIINNDTANHDTFLDLRGSEISNNTGATYFCSYRHGRVLGGKFIGNHSGRYFLSAAQVQSTGTHNVTDVYCESQDGYAQVDDAGDSTFVSRNNTAAMVTQGDFVGCTFVSNATSPDYNGAAVVQSTGISGAKLKNCVAWCNGSGTTAVYGVAWIENCSIVNARYYALNYAIDTGGAQSFTLLNSSVYSNAGSAIKIQDGSNTGTLRILNNTIHNDRYSSYGAYPTMYLQGWDNSDNLIANNTIVHGGPYKDGNLANAIEVHSGGGGNYTFNIVNNTIKVSQNDAFCISSSAAVAPNIVYAQNTFEGANVPVAPSITQALTNVPDAQGNIHVTSSLNNDRIYSGSFSGSFVGNGSLLTGVEAFPFTGDAQITGSLSFSGSLIDFTDAASVKLPAATVPLINPQVNYFTTTEITSSGTTVPLPGDLTFISSSTFEYLEIFINGLRLRYDIDFAPQSTGSVKYFVTLPVGTEVTYKSLNRPT